MLAAVAAERECALVEYSALDPRARPCRVDMLATSGKAGATWASIKTTACHPYRASREPPRARLSPRESGSANEHLDIGRVLPPRTGSGTPTVARYSAGDVA